MSLARRDLVFASVCGRVFAFDVWTLSKLSLCSLYLLPARVSSRLLGLARRTADSAEVQRAWAQRIQ